MSVKRDSALSPSHHQGISTLSSALHYHSLARDGLYCLKEASTSASWTLFTHLTHLYLEANNSEFRKSQLVGNSCYLPTVNGIR